MKIRDLDLKLKPFDPLIKRETSHSQTLLGHLFKSPQIHFQLENEFIPLENENYLSAQFHIVPESPVIIVVFHGFGGSTDSDYMQRTGLVAEKSNQSFYLINHRGVGSGVGKTNQPYHSGRSDDMGAVSQYLRQKYPGKKQVFVGFSLSGCVLLNLITNNLGDFEKPDYAISVNAPINLMKTSDLLIKGFSKIYDLRFYFLLKKLVKKNNFNAQLPFVANTQVFDELFTSQISGFENREHYYKSCSTHHVLDQIQKPTFILTSYDDPFIDFQDYKKINWNEMTHTTFVSSGGHMGYLSKNKLPHFGRRWQDYYLYTVIQNILQIERLYGSNRE